MPNDSGSGFNILQSLQNAFTTFLNYIPNEVDPVDRTPAVWGQWSWSGAVWWAS
jgi:hypothetical protein